MSGFFPLHVHSHNSLMDGLAKPKDIAKRCAKIGLAGSALTDHGSISGSVAFIEAMKNRCLCGETKDTHKKENCPCKDFRPLKPILGCEFYVSDEVDLKNRTSKQRFNSHLVVLAKNLQGWKDLIAAVSHSNHPDCVYYVPRLNLATLKEHCTGNWIAFSGHMGSALANAFFTDYKLAYTAKTYEEAKALVRPDWQVHVKATMDALIDVFGAENFYIEIQLIDKDNLPASIVVSEGLRYISKITGQRKLATPDAHYANPEDADDQRVLLSNHPSIDTPLKDIAGKLVRGEDVSLGTFFKSRKYYIPSYEDMVKIHTEDELENTTIIANACEVYDITHKPMPPKFPLPEGISAIAKLRERCREGWVNRWPLIEAVINKGEHTEAEYAERLEKELKVLEEADLADYFLIVDDIIQFARRDGQITGAGRGSADGSLVIYLIEVGHIDPIEHDLLFERFYNAGRNTKDRISLPDVDMDFEKLGRERILAYIREKYGHDKVAQISTYTRMQGRTAMQDVLRAHSACSPEERIRITENIPDEAEINDQLQDMKEADKKAGGDGDASIIEWALENRPDDFKQWCHMDSEGRLQGPMSKLFEQAIRMEGTKRSRSKHAAGIVIANEPLAGICPMVFDESSGEMIAAMEMNDLEAMGHIKFDILGIAVLDKIHGVQDLLLTGELNDEVD